MERSPAPPPDAPGPPEWRIDDLAQRAGVAVDTIRYYQREGLLPTGERVGRSLRYGPEHLERLERIRGLQARRFSLAAIRALLDHDGSVEGLLAGRDGESYDHDELVASAGISATLASGLDRAGLLRSPGDYGRAAYDAEDLEVLRAFADLAALGVPDAVLVELAETLTSGTERLQREVAARFGASAGWSAEARARFECVTEQQSARVARDAQLIDEYVRHRTIQRIVLETLERM